MIFALIEEAARFLTVMQIVAEERAVFVRADFFGDFAMENRDTLIEAFEQTHLGIIAFNDSARGKKLDQQIDEQRLEAVGGLAEILHGQVVAVVIDYQRRNLIGLAVDQAKDFGTAYGAFAEIGSLA